MSKLTQNSQSGRSYKNKIKGKTMQGFSKFFTFEDLTKTSHTKLLEKNREEAKQFIIEGKRLSKLLESIRSILGDKPISISSGFRGDTLNKAVGGATASKHMKFEAADIIPVHTDVQTAFNTIMKRKAELPNLRRVIIEKIGGKEWLHVEVKMDDSEKQVFASIGDDGKYKEVKIG